MKLIKLVARLTYYAVRLMFGLPDSDYVAHAFVHTTNELRMLLLKFHWTQVKKMRGRFDNN